MAKFDTHGGHFSPQGYLRVNEGGSHEENPNGGVQIGVDPQGIPNMLEEGEPVYNDYVYSDNIQADPDILEKYNIPASFAGKFYSQIADSFVDEAEERPLDPISTNGLNAMLSRLAEAQEEQKQIQQQKELEEELAQLSPEELAELDAMLAEQEQSQEVMPVEAVPQEQYPTEPIPETEQMMPMEQPMMPMACGGFIKRYDDGGETKQLKANGPTLTPAVVTATHPFTQGVTNAISAFPGKAKEVFDAVKDPLYAVPGIGEALFVGDLVDGVSKAVTPAPAVRPAPGVTRLMDEAYRQLDAEAAAEAARTATTTEQKAARTVGRIAKGFNWKRAIPRALATGAAMYGLGKAVNYGLDLYGSSHGNSSAAAYEGAQDDPFDVTNFAKGGEMNIYDGEHVGSGYIARYPEWAAAPYRGMDIYGRRFSIPRRRDPLVLAPGQTMPSDVPEEVVEVPTPPIRSAARNTANPFVGNSWDTFYDYLANYGVSRNPGGVSGTYAIDRRFPLGSFQNVRALEADPNYEAFTNYVLEHSGDPNVRRYLQALDAGTNANVQKLFDSEGNLISGWDTLYTNRRRDGKGGIYHLNPADIAFLSAQQEAAAPEAQATRATLPQSTLLSVIQDNVRNGNLRPVTLDEEGRVVSVAESAEPTTPAVVGQTEDGRPILSTFPQYAGALGNAGLALWNAVQPADRYDVDTPRPYLPYGRINLVDPTYNPIDQNAGVQNVLANTAGMTAAILQSGAGYAAPAALLAQGNQTGRNVGDALATIWDANNQRRNAVLAGVNNNRSQTAQFNYSNERDRANALNQYGYVRSRNNLMQQQLNYGAEGQKYGAIGQMLGNTFDALSGIGRNNVILNQINTNRKNEGFGTGHNGVVTYTPGMYYGSKGGFLKKYKG